MDRRQHPRSGTSPEPQPSSSARQASDSTLIPEHVVDAASQRLFVGSIFVALQCWKIYDILLVRADSFAESAIQSSGGVLGESFTSLNNFTFVLKYALLDGLFLWALPVLNIPMLTFSPFLTLLLTLLVNAFNFLLTSNSALPFLSSIFVPIWNVLYKHRELTISGDAVVPKFSIDPNAHFKGRYTIQYLPESSVMLNPFAFGHMCLEPPKSDSVTFPSSVRLPIEFNTTNDVGLMQIQHISPDNSIKLLNFSRSDIRRNIKKDASEYSKYPQYVATDDRVFYVDIDIKTPGQYKIHKVYDVDGMVIRPYKSDFLIGYCPSARFVYPDSPSAYAAHKCITQDTADSWTVPLVSSFGMLPLTVQIAAYQDGSQIRIFNKTISDTASENDSRRWARLKSFEMSRNILERELLKSPEAFHVHKSGKIEFHIVAVSDSSGNERVYNLDSKHPDVNFPLILKKAPQISLIDRSPYKKLVYDSVKQLAIEYSELPSFPLTIEVKYMNDTDGAEPTLTNHVFKDREALNRGITITEPGIYSLVSGHDKYCPCSTAKPSLNITISRPQPPSVEISDTPIVDKCVGTIGFEFDLKFEGTPPFEVTYEVFKNTSNSLRPVLTERGLRQHARRSNTDRLKFEYRPRQEGSYILKFMGVKDLNYDQESQPLTNTKNTFSLYLRKRSKYSFDKDSSLGPKKISLCKGQRASVPVYFEGNFPFSFRQEIVNSNTGEVVAKSEVKEYFNDILTVEVPALDGGDYKVLFKDVFDSLGCTVDSPPNNQIFISARKQVPSIDFLESKTFQIVEGDTVKVSTIIKTDSRLTNQDEINFQLKDLSDRTILKNLTSQGKSDLLLREEGIYRITNFTNDGCPGSVNNLKTIKVIYHVRPQLKISPDNSIVTTANEGSVIKVNDLCQRDLHKIKIQLEGKAPFTINYSITNPTGKVKSSSLTIDNDVIMVPVPSNQEGTYRIEFTEVFDAHYTKEKMLRLAHEPKSSVVTYEVKVAPSLFVKKQYFQICETKVGADLDIEVPISFKGSPPFNIEGIITNTQTGNDVPFSIKNLSEPQVKFSDFNMVQPLEKVFAVGEHAVRFQSISDASHCRTSQLLDNNKAMISVTKVPSITKQSEKSYYCVGDHISYNMTGISPFTVFYEFNGEERRADPSHEFTRLATKPGDLSILGLQDSSANQCMIRFAKGEEEYERLKLKIHDLPSVEISEGDSIIKNLHQGDKSEITFTFTGTPPFSLTYVRTVAESEDEPKKRKKPKSKAKRRVVETKTISDIWDYEISEAVSLQGTYEAIKVSDAFCTASRNIEEILREDI